MLNSNNHPVRHPALPLSPLVPLQWSWTLQSASQIINNLSSGYLREGRKYSSYFRRIEIQCWLGMLSQQLFTELSLDRHGPLGWGKLGPAAQDWVKLVLPSLRHLSVRLWSWRLCPGGIRGTGKLISIAESGKHTVASCYWGIWLWSRLYTSRTSGIWSRQGGEAPVWSG